jgi:hypothetical protein
MSTPALIPLPDAAPLSAVYPAKPVPAELRLNSWGEVRSAEATGNAELIRHLIWRYLWTERPEAEVYALAALLARTSAEFRQAPGIVTMEGRLSPTRWAPHGAQPPLRARALVLDAYLGWGGPVTEAALVRAENLAWLAEVQRQLRSGPSTWSHQWAHGFCPVEEGIADQLARLTCGYEGTPLSDSEEEEADMLHQVCRRAWRFGPWPRLGTAPTGLAAIEDWGQYDLLLHRLECGPVTEEAPWERLGGGRRFSIRPRLLELPSRMRALILDPPQDSPLPQTHFQELS